MTRALKSCILQALIATLYPSQKRLVGTKVLGWTVERPLGRGGTSEVYLATGDSDKQVAIKVLLPEMAQRKEIRRALSSECEMLKELDHRCIPKVHREVMIGDQPALVLEYLDGGNLMDLHKEQQRFPRLQCLIAAVTVVAHLHSKTIVHNDLKLSNFILSPKGRFCLFDFGNANRLSLTTTIFRKFRGGPQQGTATYLAPELIKGRGPTRSTDVYALGVIAHILLAGRAPFIGNTPNEIMHGALHHTATPLTTRNPRIEKRLADFFDRCMNKNPKMRYDDAEMLLAAIKSQEATAQVKRSDSRALEAKPGRG